ncbi:MAG: hypothetical protein ACI4EF_05720, partial [Coprococcus sp.]
MRIRNLVAKQNQIQVIQKYIRNKQYDACYIRYDFSDPGFIGLLKQIRKVCPKIALELPTYPYEDENKYNILSEVITSFKHTNQHTTVISITAADIPYRIDSSVKGLPDGRYVNIVTP